MGHLSQFWGEVHNWIAEIEPSQEDGILAHCVRTQSSEQQSWTTSWNTIGLRLEQNWTMEDLMERLRELNISFSQKTL